jgi:hypothetical protein
MGQDEATPIRSKKAFHPDARMFGVLAGTRYDVPITELFQLVDSGAADVEGSYRARVDDRVRCADLILRGRSRNVRTS